LEKDEAEVNKVALNEQQIKKNMDDYIISKKNFHNMRKKAYEFEENYRKLLNEYDVCVSQFNKQNIDIENN
jgi:hypothetical protein